MRGHTLVWHSQSPEWVFKEGFNASGAYVNSATMDARMESYIKNLFNAIKTQYPGLNLYAYDVANECVSDDSNRTANYGGAREPGYGNGKSPWVQIYGSNSFVEKAFTYARKYAPEGCDLYYNDYNEYWDHKRDCIYNMCKSLYEKGLLDGVGMQSHINADASGFSGTANYITAMKSICPSVVMYRSRSWISPPKAASLLPSSRRTNTRRSSRRLWTGTRILPPTVE